MARKQKRRRERRRHRHAQRRGLSLQKSLITGAGISAGAVLGLAPAASAASFAVDTTADTGATAGECTSASSTDCSLRQAIDAANTAPNPVGLFDYITFNSDVTGTITVGSELLISDPVYINGPAANALTVSGGGTTRIFDIDLAGPSNYPVGIYRLTLSGGHTLSSGGAIYDHDAVLKVNESVLSGNYAGSFGGAIYMHGSDAQQGHENVVYADTITGNTAGEAGGGVYGSFSVGSVVDSTVTGNHLSGSANLNYFGAGVASFNYGYIVDSTIAGNGPAYWGAGVGGAQGMGIFNSILADNTATSFPDLHAGAGVHAGFSLIENGSPIATETGPNLIGQDPQLGPLQNNGGLTPTMRPAAASPVVDKGSSDTGHDQRLGDRRVDNPNVANAQGGNGADMGALELSLAEGPQAAVSAPPPHKKKKCKKHKKKQAASAKKCKKKKKK
jgi:predicted outer membrane repeat protein